MHNQKEPIHPRLSPFVLPVVAHVPLALLFSLLQVGSLCAVVTEKRLEAPYAARIVHGARCCVRALRHALVAMVRPRPGERACSSLS